MKIRKHDIVKVISGDGAARGQTGKVIRVLDNDRLLVQGVNMVWKHMRRSQQHPHGARIEKEATIHVSNVMLVCPSCGKASKVAMEKVEGGDKSRLCKKCKAVIPAGTA
ncbi:MAG TPA: 50S ribosomal protein L24 [Planctomycetota bacterium]|nr:50S ribosomal protein L24 [Planctomycetota bacterium]